MSEGRNPSVSERVYRALLLAYPKGFRDAYGPRMVQAFGDLLRQEFGRAGTIGLLVLWARTVWDLLSTAFAERSKTVVPVFSSTGMMRAGGFAAMVGGVLGVLAGLGRGIVWRTPYSSSPVMYDEEVLNLLGSFASLLIAAGMLGLYASMRNGPRKLATLGVGLACLATATLAVAGVYGSVVLLSSGYPENAIVPPGVFGVGATVGFVGFLLFGVALFTARALGRWSVLPLVLGLLPLATPIVFLALPAGLERSIGGPGLLPSALLLGPAMVVDLGWILVGYLLWSGRTRASERSPRVA